jgi:hypothetical protein
MNLLFIVDQDLNIPFRDQLGLSAKDHEDQCDNNKGEENYTQNNF